MTAVTTINDNLASEPAGAECIRFSGRLASSPFKGRLCGTELPSLPMLDPEEYRHLAVLEPGDRAAPVLLSWSQHYELLDLLVKAARRHLPASALICISHGAPNHVVPLPPALLAADVLLCCDAQATARLMLEHGQPSVVAIEDSFRRDGHEEGCNEIRICQYRQCDPSAFGSFLEEAGVYDYLGDVRLEYQRSGR